MRLPSLKERLAVMIAIISCVLPVDRLAAAQVMAERPHAGAVIRDVALEQSGRLAGRVLDSDGQPIAGPVVVLDEAGNEAGSAWSGADGLFQVTGVHAGVYRVATSAGSVACRCWAVGTAPPSAVDRLLVVEDETILRGQRPIGEFLFSPPVLLVALVVAAIAIPIAIHNSQDDDDAS